MAPRKPRTPATEQAEQRTETAPETEVPATPPKDDPAKPAAGDPAAAAPPPADEPVQAAPPSPEPPAAPPPTSKPAQAAPLEPPAAPLTPPEPIGAPVQINMLATPGSEFVDLVWDDGTPCQPEDLFTDPGPQYTTVLARAAIIRRHYQPGARRISDQLLMPAGWKLARDHAEKIKADLAEQRAKAADQEE
ncbi:hypothetical protein ACFWYW_46470 [Nonomuraea sp. NPDC059023]|uniref:hypothetical protein n=1 Tax=unclassified Nonomuraea TaxID=2593643 RepID=UPI003686B553